jgi:hypothetical protein
MNTKYDNSPQQMRQEVIRVGETRISMTTVIQIRFNE